MKHQIVTDGNKFRVQTPGNKPTKYEMKWHSGCYEGYYAIVEFRSERAARRFIIKKYGTSAKISIREWRPI